MPMPIWSASVRTARQDERSTDGGRRAWQAEVEGSGSGAVNVVAVVVVVVVSRYMHAVLGTLGKHKKKKKRIKRAALGQTGTMLGVETARHAPWRQLCCSFRASAPAAIGSTVRTAYWALAVSTSPSTAGLIVWLGTDCGQALEFSSPDLDTRAGIHHTPPSAPQRL